MSFDFIFEKRASWTHAFFFFDLKWLHYLFNTWTMATDLTFLLNKGWSFWIDDLFLLRRLWLFVSERFKSNACRRWWSIKKTLFPRVIRTNINLTEMNFMIIVSIYTFLLVQLCWKIIDVSKNFHVICEFKLLERFSLIISSMNFRISISEKWRFDRRICICLKTKVLFCQMNCNLMLKLPFINILGHCLFMFWNDQSFQNLHSIKFSFSLFCNLVYLTKSITFDCCLEFV